MIGPISAAIAAEAVVMIGVFLFATIKVQGYSIWSLIIGVAQ